MLNWDKSQISAIERDVYKYEIQDNDGQKLRVIREWGTFISIHNSQSIQNCLFFCEINLPHHVNISRNTIHFKNCYFHKDVNFTGEFNKSLFIDECDFNSSIYFENPLIHEYLFIQRSEVKYINIQGGKFGKRVDLDVCGQNNTGTSIDILEGEFDYLNIGNSSRFKTIIDTISISTSKATGNIYIVNSDTEIQNLYLNHASSKLNVFFEDFKVNNLSILGFTNSDRFRISNIKPLSNKSEFKIRKSNLGKTEFLNVNLSLFNIVNIVDSNISDVIFINTIWSKNKDITSYNQNGSIIEKIKFRTKYQRLYLKPNEEETYYYFKNREVYRQLKYAQSKQGDIVMEQYFHSKEMHAHVKSLELWPNLPTVLIIHLSRLTSDFGQSISKPITTLLTIHYWLFMLAIGCGATDIKYPDYLHDFVYQYCYLINPIHQYSFTTNGAIIIDILMRITSSYMIYNFIRASRRFIK